MSEADIKITEEDLVAFADERLDAPRLTEVETWLADRPDERRKVETWRAQTAMLRAALDPVAAEPAPASMIAAVRTYAPRRNMWIGPALAASIALAAGLGGGWYLGQTGWPVILGEEESGEALARSAYRAHRLYVAEVRHPVEIGASDQGHLASWLSNRLEAPLKIPDLTNQGLRLLGGRLLPVDGKPGAQLMYESANGDRYTLFVARADGEHATPFHFEEWGNIGCYYWIDGGLGYALNGPKDRERLMTIATAAYNQLS
jgi:anti-sigma factor RsiW